MTGRTAEEPEGIFRPRASGLHLKIQAIADVPALIEFLSSKTLLPGTVILTGTPHGVGVARKPPVFLKAGDTVSVEIESIGTLTNPVVNERVG